MASNELSGTTQAETFHHHADSIVSLTDEVETQHVAPTYVACHWPSRS